MVRLRDIKWALGVVRVRVRVWVWDKVRGPS